MAYVYFILCFVLLYFANALETNFWRCDYKYVKKTSGFFKYHYIPATWHDARLRCQDEGAVLASPYPREVHDTLLDLMSKRNLSRPIFTGIHATFSKGDYYAIDGTPLSKIPVNWMDNEPNNHNNEEECLIFTSGGLMADKKCDRTYPYICYKEKKEGDHMLLGICGTTDPGYEYSKVTGSCYKYHRVPRTWSRAFLACSAEGGHLVISNSDAEAEVIRNLIAKNPDDVLVGKFRKDLTHVGFHDWNEHGDWRTIHGQTLHQAGFAKFQDGEPNNVPPGESCGSVNRLALFNDLLCKASVTFICEKKPHSLLCDNDQF